MKTSEKLEHEFRSKKLALKQKNVTIQMAGVTITFSVNFGFLLLWRDAFFRQDYFTATLSAFVILVLNGVGYYATRKSWHEGNNDLKKIYPEKLFNPQAKYFDLASGIGFFIICVFWVWLLRLA